MCFITHSSMFQFIVLLFHNIVIIHVADLLTMFCFCNKYFLLINSHVLFLHVCQAHYYGVVSVEALHPFLFMPMSGDQ
jgi:hypothetical protein